MEPASLKAFDAGEVIFRQGEASTEMYHIQTGRVGISIQKNEGLVQLADLGPGALFGEMALISGPPRTATATALEPVTTLVIPDEMFRKSVVGLPEWALSITQVLVDRLRNTTSSLDKMMYEKSHSAVFEGQQPRGPINIAPQGLEVFYYPDTDIHRLHLSGTLGEADLDKVLNLVNSLRRQNISPVILNFSNVVDVQRQTFETLVTIARDSTDATGKVQVENVQLIAEKVQKHKGLQEILHTSQAPLRRVGFQENLICQGDLGDEMFVVKSGLFTISRVVNGKEIVLWRAGEGDVIGEMALVSGRARTATVRAEKSSEVYVIDIREFEKNAFHIPRWFMNIIEGLVVRLRDTNQKLDDFVNGPENLVALPESHPMGIFENVQVPGACILTGDLTEENVKILKSYFNHRMLKGVTEFSLDVAGVKSVDKAALKFLVSFHKYLLNIRGKLEINGSRKTLFPLEL